MGDYHLHPSLSGLEAGEAEGGPLAVAATMLAEAGEKGAKEAAMWAMKRGPEVEQELANLSGFHPVRRSRLRAERQLVEALMEVVGDSAPADLWGEPQEFTSEPSPRSEDDFWGSAGMSGEADVGGWS